MRSPLPARASYRDLLRDLLGRPVTVRPGATQLLQQERPGYLASYRFDDAALAAVTVADLSLATAMAAAMAAMPSSQAREKVEEAGHLEEELLESLRAVADASAKLLNSPSTPHVVLREMKPVPGDVSADVAGLATTPGVRVDWLVAVEGYGEGLVTLLA